MNTSMPPRASPRDPSTLTWRLATPADAGDLVRIYNESVAGGGHSPTLANGNEEEMRALIAQGRRKGWPVWVMTAPAPPDSDSDSAHDHDHDDGRDPGRDPGHDGGGDRDGGGSADAPRVPVAWAHLRTISWAQGVCRSTGDLWLYVAETWQGSGIAMRMIRVVFKECRRYGFDAVTCWILGANRRSLSLARACRLDRWALMPAVVDYGGRRFDLEVWGCRLDDPAWLAHMDRLGRRQAGLERLRATRGGAAAVEACAAPAAARSLPA